MSAAGPVARTLVLVRHAEAASPLGTVDFDRPLTDRGVSQAQATARWLAATAPAPQFVWCSAAVRTRRTLAALAPFVGDAAVDVDTDLYDATLPVVLGGIRSFDPACTDALVVFHNPAVAQAAAVLDPGSGRSYAVTPASAVVVRFDTPWTELGADVVTDFVVREGS